MTITENFERFQYFNFEINFLKNALFKKLEYCFLAESTKIDNKTFADKTALSEATVKTNRMGSTKLTNHKEQSFASNHFPFSKILFQFSNLVYRVDVMYQPNVHIHAFLKHWNFTL